MNLIIIYSGLKLIQRIPLKIIRT